MANILADTNIIMDNPDIFNTIHENVTVHSITCEELDNIIHNSLDEEKKYKARHARNAIQEATNRTYCLHSPTSEFPLGWDVNKNDNKLIMVCKECGYKLYTNDLAMQIKADSIGIEWCDYKSKTKFDSYLGYKEVIMDEYEMSTHYQCPVNKWDLLQGEYLIIRDKDGNIADKVKWTDKGFKNISYKTVESRYVGKIKPRNLQQELYMDMLQDKETKIKVVQGNYGTGKDYLALSYFLNLIEKGVYDKLIWIRNNIEVDGTKPIGFLPGSLTEKLSVFADIIGDFVGDKIGFEMLLASGKLELAHAGFLRGRDLRNSIIYCTEAQNMSSAIVKLIISRISEGSIVFFNGDVKQIDDNRFKNNNGLNLVINKIKGHHLFGYVYLDKCERSEVAQLASLLD